MMQNFKKVCLFVLLFLQNQHEDGFIARSVPSNPSHDNEHVKPFLSQIALLGHFCEFEDTLEQDITIIH